MNDSTFYGIDNIHAAIAEDSKISFRYFQYNLQNEKIHNKPDYTASPYPSCGVTAIIICLP
jgi:hypothetical protein